MSLVLITLFLLLLLSVNKDDASITIHIMVHMSIRGFIGLDLDIYRDNDPE